MRYLSPRETLGGAGYTIGELVAVLVLTFGVLSLSSFLLFNAQLHESRLVPLATVAAQTAIEDARDVSFADLALGSTTDTVEVDSIIMWVTTVVTPQEPDLKLLTVSVQLPTGKELVTLETHFRERGSR